MRIEEHLLKAAIKLRDDWTKQMDMERTVEDAALWQAHSEKRALIDHHWQARYKAEERLRAIDRIIEAIREASTAEIK